MVGLNYEFGRKLLWREYPTDQRGSYFRQFWDVRSYIDSEGLSENALKEKLYDIPRAAPLAADLGARHAQQPRSGAARPASRPCSSSAASCSRSTRTR